MAKKNNKKRNILIFISLLILAIIAMFIFSNREAKPIEVTFEKVSSRTIIQKVSAVGKIQAETEVKVSPETSGEVITLNVKEGDTVRKGELLIRIKPDIVQTIVEQSQASVNAAKMDAESIKEKLKLAEADFNRAKELFRNKYISQQEFDTYNSNYQALISNYKSALARLEQAQASLRQVLKNADRTTIYSPINGVVTKRNVEIGETVLGTQQFQGTEMLRISDLTVMNAIVEVDENDIVLVRKGDTASVEIDALPDLVLKGIVIEIGHSAIQTNAVTQDQSTNFSVKIRLIDPDPRLRPGMSCNSEITTETKYNTPSVPLQSVTVRTINNLEDGPGIRQVKDDEEIKIKKRPPTIVFVRDKDKVKSKVIKTGISDDGYIEIIEGLDLGDEVVSGSFQAISKLLEDGSRITVQKKESKLQSKKK